MPSLTLTDFAGIAPAIHPKKLPNNFATIADNARIDRRVLEGWKGMLLDAVSTSGNSLYRYQGAWIVDAADRDYVRSLLPNDSREFIFYTDDDYPKIRSGASSYRLGLPRPAVPPVSINDAGDMANITDVRDQRYAVTIVDAWGFEGPTSQLSAGVIVGKDSVVDVDLTGCTIIGNYNLDTGSKFRIYRTNTGSQDTYLQFVGEVDYGTASFADSVNPGDLQEVAPSQTWVAAPDDQLVLYPDGPLQGLVALPGGVLAGFSGNTLFLSEPYVPTAWPYYYAIKDKIVALAAIQGGLFVATEGKPVLFTGNHPSTLAEVPVEAFQPCISKRSMVDMGDFAIYASPDGLVAAQGNTASLITDGYINSDSEILTTDIRAFRYEHLYVAFYGDPANGTGFVYDTKGANGERLISLSGFNVSAGYNDPLTGDLYLLYDDAGQWTVGKFNEGNPLQFVWQSKIFSTPDPSFFNCLRLEADAYPVTVQLFADGADRGSYVIPDSQVHKLPGGYRAKEWQVKVTGSTPVTSLYLSDNVAEIS